MFPYSKLMASNVKDNPVGDVKSAPSSTPSICLLLFAANAACGAFTGSIFGYCAGLFKKKGFKGSFIEARSNAKTFAILSGVESLVVCIMARLRGKHDAINAGIAGCCTGLAISFPGAPQTLLKNCLTFGALTFIIEWITKQKPALAYSISKKTSVYYNNIHPPLVLPLQLPLPNDMIGDFSFFHESFKNRKKGISPASH